MKITVRKKRGGLSVAFRATTDDEGVDLKDVVLNTAKTRGGTLHPMHIVGELAQLGYKTDALETSDKRIEATLTRPFIANPSAGEPLPVSCDR